jgi:uncharacterized protein (DUF952 family)
MIRFIYHITSHALWSNAQQNGRYSADSLTTEGFIHCSMKAQLLRVANRRYSNRSDLVILEISLSELEPEVRWDPAADQDNELFPHVYGPINIESVVGVYNFEPRLDGNFDLPQDIESMNH